MMYQICVNGKPIGIICCDSSMDAVVASVRLTYPKAWVDVQLYIGG